VLLVKWTHRLAANCKAACAHPNSREVIKPILMVSLIILYVEQSTFRDCHLADLLGTVSYLQKKISGMELTLETLIPIK
jgi:hypothetical protein